MASPKVGKNQEVMAGFDRAFLEGIQQERLHEEAASSGLKQPAGLSR